MTFKYRRQRWRGLTPLLLILVTFSATPVRADDEFAPAQLLLSPQSCVAEHADKPCVEHLTVRWKIPAAVAFCVWRDGDEQPLFCQQDSSGERNISLSIQATTQFLLLERDSKNPLASAELVVLANTEQHFRRRYQHPWSVF